MTKAHLIAVVDDDESVRESLPDLLRSFGYDVDAFESAEAFLASGPAPNIAALVLDIVMPGMSGPELSQELKRRGLNIPTIFMTAQSGGTKPEDLLKRGAVAFLLKPFDPVLLIDALKTALPNP